MEASYPDCESSGYESPGCENSVLGECLSLCLSPLSPHNVSLLSFSSLSLFSLSSLSSLSRSQRHWGVRRDKPTQTEVESGKRLTQTRTFVAPSIFEYRGSSLIRRLPPP